MILDGDEKRICALQVDGNCQVTMAPKFKSLKRQTQQRVSNADMSTQSSGG